MSKDTMPRISVIIPVYNAAATLDACLRAVTAQSYPRDRYEVIVVDNNSSDSSLEIAMAHDVTITEECERQSSYAARNQGLEIASGDMIAFTDSDCIPATDWLETLANCWDDSQTGCFAGEIEAHDPQTLVERFSRHIGLLRQKGAVSGWHHKPFAQTANAAYRREVIDQLGGFNADMISGGDADLAWRMQEQTSYGVRFVPEAVVYHCHRVDLPGLFAQFRRYGDGKLSWTQHHPDYEIPSLAQEEQRVLEALTQALDSMQHEQVPEEQVLYPYLKAVTAMAHYVGRAQSQQQQHPHGAKPSATPDSTHETCNICGGQDFIPGPNGRLSYGKPPMCLNCGSLERHRILRDFWSHLQPMIKDLHVLQFARDTGLNPAWVKELEYSVYGGENSLDVMAIDRPANKYGCVIANHVIEHVSDDIAAIREMLRLVGPSGMVQVTVPSPCLRLSTEDWGFADPSQNKHYRDYGSDFGGYVSTNLPDIGLLQIIGRDPVTGLNDIIYVLSADSERLEAVARRIRSGRLAAIFQPAQVSHQTVPVAAVGQV